MPRWMFAFVSTAALGVAAVLVIIVDILNLSLQPWAAVLYVLGALCLPFAVYLLVSRTLHHPDTSRRVAGLAAAGMAGWLAWIAGMMIWTVTGLPLGGLLGAPDEGRPESETFAGLAVLTVLAAAWSTTCAVWMVRTLHSARSQGE